MYTSGHDRYVGLGRQQNRDHVKRVGTVGTFHVHSLSLFSCLNISNMYFTKTKVAETDIDSALELRLDICMILYIHWQAIMITQHIQQPKG